MPQSPTELTRIREETIDKDDTFELEDTAVGVQEPSPTNMPLKAALNIGASDSPLELTTKRKRGLSAALDYPAYDCFPGRSRPPEKALPLVPPMALKTAELRALRRRKNASPSCSLLCDEEEAVFPTRKWSKPLAEMGDAVKWKISVLKQFNAIAY